MVERARASKRWRALADEAALTTPPLQRAKRAGCRQSVLALLADQAPDLTRLAHLAEGPFSAEEADARASGAA